MTCPAVVRVSVPSGPSVARVATPGPPGPPGNPAAYVHTQATPSSSWIINHNLGYRPSVELLDAGSQEIEGEIAHPSINQTVVGLSPPTAGLARLI